MSGFSLPKNRLADFIEGRWRRFRIRTRSRLIGGAFTLINALTRYDIEGRENLLNAVRRSVETGRGLMTVSNHVSLFDDPMVLCAVLRIRNFTVERKCWWSTACASNFDPHEPGAKSKMVRMFSETANMVFFARSYKGCKAAHAPESLVEALRGRIGWRRMALLEERAARAGQTAEQFLRGFLTARPGEVATSLDQLGLIESCARLSVGDWLHFFPEAGRSRTMSLRPARPGVGKVIYHCGDIDVIPMCFYGTQDVLPIGAIFPRPLRRVVVSIGKPLNTAVLDGFRRESATPDTFLRVAQFAMAGVAALRLGVLVRYVGTDAAFRLVEEEQAEEALAAAEETKVPSDRVTPVPEVRPGEEFPWPEVARDRWPTAPVDSPR